MTSISQVKYWLEGTTYGNGDDKEGAEGGTFLSYELFMGLSVLGGFFALDHMYLRSPHTALAKFFVNIFCFGLWWLYDAVQVVFNRDVIKLYGVGIPGWGPTGIGAGVLTKDVPDKKHLRFVLYSISLFFGGLIGIDSFVVGDRQTGIIRLLLALSFIFLPVALLWWGYEIFQYFTNLEEVIGAHHEFFGAPQQSIASRWSRRFPLLGWLFSPLETVKNLVNNIFGPALLEPVTKTAQAAINTVDHAVSAIDGTVQLGRAAIEKSGAIIDQVGKTIETVSQASTMLPAASLYAAAQQELKGAQSGGSQSGSPFPQENLNPLGYLLLVTLALISVSGFAVTWYRNRNVKREKGTATATDDAPPEPGIFRESH